MTLTSDARSPTDAVHVVARTARSVELHDPAHVRKVESARGHVLCEVNDRCILHDKQSGCYKRLTVQSRTPASTSEKSAKTLLRSYGKSVNQPQDFIATQFNSKLFASCCHEVETVSWRR